MFVHGDVTQAAKSRVPSLNFFGAALSRALSNHRNPALKNMERQSCAAMFDFQFRVGERGQDLPENGDAAEGVHAAHQESDKDKRRQENADGTNNNHIRKRGIQKRKVWLSLLRRLTTATNGIISGSPSRGSRLPR